MGKTSIEWTDASWNPIVGCTEISPGCANCYAARLAATRLRNTLQYSGLASLRTGRLEDAASAASISQSRPHWTGQVRFLPERLNEPLHWRKPRRIFVCDMGDLFHESVSADWIFKVWAIMASCPQHTFQILTKRADRMYHFVSYGVGPLYPPLKNVWLGVSVENQHFADERIPLLLQTPAAVRWISAEPLLGPVDLYKLRHATRKNILVDWIVCGGESGPNARPMDPDWVRLLRYECQLAGVPFFFKQWGAWAPYNFPPMIKVGKKKAGRLLDGREWNEFPTWPAVERRRGRYPLKMLADLRRLGIRDDRRKDA